MSTETSSGQDMIVVLDLGSRENPRLMRELRELGVACELRPHTITLDELNALPNVKGVILNGGPDGAQRSVAPEICNAPMPVLMVDYQGDAPWPEDEQLRRETLFNFVMLLCGANAG